MRALSEEDVQAIIVEELGPEPDYASMQSDAAEEQRSSREMKETRIRYNHGQEARETYLDVITEFRGERVPIEVTQADLRKLAKDQKSLQETFSRFLEIDLREGDEDLETRRSKAKSVFYDLTGGFEPSKWAGERNMPELIEYCFMNSIKYTLIPHLSEEIDSLIAHNTVTWRMPRNEAYERLLEMLVDHPQLRRRAFKLKERWDPDHECAQGSTYWSYED